MMKRFRILLFFALVLTSWVRAEDFLNIATLLNSSDTESVFESAGVSDVRKNVEENAAKSLFHALFYVGVEGINEGKPLIEKENLAYTGSFFNQQARYTFYVVNIEPVSKIKKTDNTFRATYKVRVRMQKLLTDLKANKVYGITADKGFNNLETEDVKMAENIVLPTIIVVPYRRAGENFSAILQNDYDRRIAVAKVQDGFESRDITTVDLQAKIDAVNRRAAYEQNAGAADSNDKQLLLTSGADVYVTVDMQKDIQASGSRVTLILKAYETSSGNVLASKTVTPVRRFQTTAIDALCAYAVQDNIQPFLNDIVKNFTPSNGTRVVLQFAIDGTSATTMNDPVGLNNYSLSNTVRNWVRKNAYMGKYHLQGVMDDSMIFDYVMIPPKDADGLRMDAAQFAFLIESYLKEEVDISCATRVDGNNIMVTIY